MICIFFLILFEEKKKDNSHDVTKGINQDENGKFATFFGLERYIHLFLKAWGRCFKEDS